MVKGGSGSQSRSNVAAAVAVFGSNRMASMILVTLSVLAVEGGHGGLIFFYKHQVG